MLERIKKAIAAGRESWKQMEDKFTEEQQAEIDSHPTEELKELQRQLFRDDAKQVENDRKNQVQRINGSPRELLSDGVLVNQLVLSTEDTPAHQHKFRKGILPGGKYVKTCSVCGDMVSIEQSEWITLA